MSGTHDKPAEQMTKTVILPRAAAGASVTITNASDDVVRITLEETDVAKLARFRLEQHPTNPPIPMAIWDISTGWPGSGARLVANFYQTCVTLEEAQKMCAALNYV